MAFFIPSCTKREPILLPLYSLLTATSSIKPHKPPFLINFFCVCNVNGRRGKVKKNLKKNSKEKFYENKTPFWGRGVLKKLHF